MEAKRWQQRLLDFEKACDKLALALEQKEFRELEKDGVVKSRTYFRIDLENA